MNMWLGWARRCIPGNPWLRCGRAGGAEDGRSNRHGMIAASMRSAREGREWPLRLVPNAFVASWQLLQAGLVLPGPRVDPDGVAFVDEQGHVDDEARLRRRGLPGTLRGVAGEP